MGGLALFRKGLRQVLQEMKRHAGDPREQRPFSNAALVAVALIAMLTARVTVMRSLTSML